MSSPLKPCPMALEQDVLLESEGGVRQPTIKFES